MNTQGIHEECGACGKPRWAHKQEVLCSEPTSQPALKEFRRALDCLYIAVDESVAKDFATKVNALIDEYEGLLRRSRSTTGALPPEPRPTQWISAEEKLPQDGVSALIFVPRWEDLYLRNRVAWIDYDENPPQWIYDGKAVEGVSHWQPLPAAPRTSCEGEK